MDWKFTKRNLFKESIVVLGVFAVFAAPGLIIHNFPKDHQAEIKLIEKLRRPSSVTRPASQRCRQVRKVRWRCERVNGQRDCRRNGYVLTKHCEPLSRNLNFNLELDQSK